MPPRRFLPAALDLFVLLFALSAMLGVLPAYDLRLSTGTLVAILLSAALYFAIAYLPRSQAAVRVVGLLSLGAAVTFALYFVTQYGYNDYPEKGGFIARLGQLTTLLPDLSGFSPFPNAAAAFLEAAVPLGIAMAVSSRRAASRAVLAACTLLVLYAVFLTASRGSWLALGATAGLAVALTALARLPRQTARRVVGAGLVVAVLGLLAIIALGPERLPFLASTFSRATDRGRLFLNSLHLGGDYAFTGIGLGDTFSMVYSRYSLLLYVPFLNYAHNLPLSVWLNQGLLGVVALIGMVVTFYRFVRRVTQSSQPTAVFHGAWLGVAAALLHGLTDAPQYAEGHHWLMPVLFAWLGMSVASGRLAMREAARPVESPPRSHLSRPVLIGAALAVVVLLALFNRPILAAWHTNLGAIAEARAELAPNLDRAERQSGFASAAESYRRALAVDPGHVNANRRAGNLAANQDRFEDAVLPLERAYEQEKTYPAAVKGLGLAYTWVGRADDAARLFLRLDDPGAMLSELYTWGNYRAEQGQPLLAAYAYEAAQAMVPDSTGLDGWLAIADKYREAGALDAARAWYNRVLAVDSENERALNALAEIGR